jgi:copper transport protein
VSLRVAPTRLGPQTMQLFAYSDTGAALRIADASGSLQQPGSGLGPIRFTFTRTGEGTATAWYVRVPRRGSWTLTTQVRTADLASYAAATTYTVR